MLDSTDKKDYQGPLYAPHPDLYEKRKELGLVVNEYNPTQWRTNSPLFE